MIYTEEQFQALAPFEGYFRTATRSGYAGYVGFRNAEKIDKIIRAAGLYKSGARTNYACASCVLRILRVAGKAYFQDKEARIAAANDAEAAKLSAAAQEPVEEPAQEPETALELESEPEQTPELSAQQALDESAKKPSLDVEVDGDLLKVTATYLAPEPAPVQEPEPEPAAAAAQEPASAPSTPKAAPTPAKTPKAAKTTQKSKTAKK